MVGGILAGILVGLFIISPKLGQNQEPGKQHLPLTVGSPVRDFTLYDLSGAPVTIQPDERKSPCDQFLGNLVPALQGGDAIIRTGCP